MQRADAQYRIGNGGANDDAAVMSGLAQPPASRDLKRSRNLESRNTTPIWRGASRNLARAKVDHGGLLRLEVPAAHHARFRELEQALDPVRYCILDWKARWGRSEPPVPPRSARRAAEHEVWDCDISARSALGRCPAVMDCMINKHERRGATRPSLRGSPVATGS